MDEFNACKGDINKIKEWMKTNDIHADNDHALYLSAFYAHLEIVHELIKAGADVHAVNDYALRYSSSYGYLEVVRELLKYYKYIQITKFNYIVKLKCGSRVKHYINLISIMIDLPCELYDEIAQFI